MNPSPAGGDPLNGHLDTSVTVRTWTIGDDPPEPATDSRYTVLIRPGHGPVALAGPDGYAPVMTAGADVRLTDVADTDTVSLLDLDPPGIVVVDDAGHVIGVVPAETLDRYLAAGAGPAVRTMGPLDSTAAAALHGRHTTPAATVLCAAGDCGFPNTLAFYDRRHPPACQNPRPPRHPLTVSGTG